MESSSSSAMNLLPSSTVRLIASSQVITSVSSVVKELIENSLDAGASSIEIKLDGWGLERIEVRDNGCGIKPEDAPFMAQAHYTSKISSDNDLKSLQTYGFRGEALGSLSSVSNVSVLTKTKSEEVGMLYTLERNGKIGATQPKPTTTGTTIIATNLFKNLPVRKQFSSNSKKCKDELKRVEDLVMAYALIHPALRIILRHNKTVVWQKSKVAVQRTALLSVFGTSLLAQMGVVEFHDEKDSGIHILGYFPRPGYDLEITGRAVNDRCFIFFNGRPVNMKPISQLIKQYYNKQTTVSSNRYPVAFLSVNVPPALLDVNLEPNKTSVMLTNKDELITILSNLLEEFYSDEKNKLPSSKNIDCNNDAEKRIALIGKLGDITNTCGLIGEVTTHASSIAGEKSKGKEGSLHLGRDIVEEDTPSLEHGVKETQKGQAQTSSSSSLLGNNSTHENTLNNKNDLQREKLSCHDEISPTSRAKEKPPSSFVTSNQAVSSPSSQQGDISMLSPTDSLQSVELFETLGDKTLCEVSESTCNVENMCNSSKVSSSVAENGNFDTGNSLSNSNGDKSNKHNEIPVTANTRNHSSNATNADGRPEGNQELSKNRTLVCPRSKSPLLENFSLDLGMDDLFEDSDLDLTGIIANSKTSGSSSHVRNSGKDASAETSSSATVEGTASVTKPSVAVAVSSETTKALCSDKEWSTGRGILDKQGNPVQPVSLVTPGPPKQVPVNRTPVTFCTPQHGKRKHSSVQEKSRLSLSSKKIKKSPEITNQPLIKKVMSPNPLQRKLLYKKTEIPFSLSDLKESVKRKIDIRPVEDANSNHLIGRLDPWGVWLLRRGTNIVCVNQYRIQEQLLFRRLMCCHSLPKEGLNHPITLNERIVGGPDCWSTLCNMSTRCDPPDTTRWIDDERLTANGFDVCLKTDAESGETKVELYKMSTSIPFYGVPDLTEVLELVRQKDSGSNSLSSCRPFKVIHYLQGEAVRVARALSSRMNSTEVDELLSRMEEQIPEDARTCVHGRPFFETIGKIPQE